MLQQRWSHSSQRAEVTPPPSHPHTSCHAQLIAVQETRQKGVVFICRCFCSFWLNLCSFCPCVLSDVCLIYSFIVFDSGCAGSRVPLATTRFLIVWLHSKSFPFSLSPSGSRYLTVFSPATPWRLRLDRNEMEQWEKKHTINVRERPDTPGSSCSRSSYMNISPSSWILNHCDHQKKPLRSLTR